MSSLSESELKELRSVTAVKQSKILSKLVGALKKYRSGKRQFDRTAVYEQVYDKTYEPKSDQVLRNRLTELNGHIEALLIQKEVEEDLETYRSKRNLYFLKACLKRQLFHLFDSEFEKSYAHAVKNLQFKTAADMLEILYRRHIGYAGNLMDIHRLKELGDRAREQRRLYIRNAHFDIRIAELMIIFFEQGVKQREDRDPAYRFDFTREIDLEEEHYSNPLAQFRHLRGSQLALSENAQGIPFLLQCLEILDQCRVEGFDYLREKGILYHALTLAYIEQKDWKEALKWVRLNGELELQRFDHHTANHVSCRMGILRHLNKHRKSIELAAAHEEHFDLFSRDSIQLERAFSHLVFDETRAVRKILSRITCDADQLDLEQRIILMFCMYQEGDLEAAVNEYENLFRTSRSRKNKGMYDYLFEGLRLTGKFLHTRQDPQNEQKKALTDLQKEIALHLAEKRVSNVELDLYEWLEREVGKVVE